MKLIEIFQGKWLGHPLHPAIVHIPLALWVGAAVCDLILVTGRGGEMLAQLALYGVIGGFAGTFLAVPSGVADWLPIKKEKPAWKLGLTHMLLNLAAVFTWAVNLGLRINAHRAGERVTMPLLILSLIGAGLLLVSGYIGSLMVFTQGTSVARFSKKKWRAVAATGGANLPPEK